jgi:predicted CoA-binding protein
VIKGLKILIKKNSFPSRISKIIIEKIGAIWLDPGIENQAVINKLKKNEKNNRFRCLFLNKILIKKQIKKEVTK